MNKTRSKQRSRKAKTPKKIIVKPDEVTDDPVAPRNDDTNENDDFADVPVLVCANDFVPVKTEQNDSADESFSPPQLDFAYAEPLTNSPITDHLNPEPYYDKSNTIVSMNGKFSNVKMNSERLHEISKVVVSYCHQREKDNFLFIEGWCMNDVFAPASLGDNISSGINRASTCYNFCFEIVRPKPIYLYQETFLEVPRTGNQPFVFLGNPLLGVYLSRRPDAILPAGFIPDTVYRMNIYKVVFKKFELIDVTSHTNNSTKAMDPRFKIRLANESDPESKDAYQRFLQNLIYIYDVNELSCEVAEQPDLITPYASIDFVVDNSCSAKYKGSHQLHKTGVAEMEIPLNWKLNVNQHVIDKYRPQINFALRNIIVQPLTTLSAFSDLNVFHQAISRDYGDFEKGGVIRFHHAIGIPYDTFISHTCFTSDDPRFIDLSEYMVMHQKGAFLDEPYVDCLRPNRVDINYILLPNTRYIELFGVPYYPEHIIHYLEIKRVYVNSAFCSLRREKLEQLLFNLPRANGLPRADRISNNDLRSALLTAENTVFQNQRILPYSSNSFDVNNTERLDEEAYTDDEEAYSDDKEPTSSAASNPQVSRGPKKTKQGSNSRKKAAPKRKRGATGSDTVDKNVAKRVSQTMPNTTSKPSSSIQDWKPDYKCPRLSMQRITPVDRSKITMSTGVLFDPAMFHRSAVTIALLDEILTASLCRENEGIVTNLSVIVHSSLFTHFNTYGGLDQNNGNSILYANCFAKYMYEPNFVIQKKHFCDKNIVSFRMFMICALATLKKYNIDNAIVLTCDDEGANHDVYERNKIKVLQPIEYLEVLHTGDNSKFILPETHHTGNHC